MKGIAGTKDWIQRVIPDPNDKDRSTQFGVLIEEVSELLQQVELPESPGMILDAISIMSGLATVIKASNTGIVVKDREEFLDALCDIQVTTTTTAHTHHMAIVAALDAVNESNESKLVDGQPIFDENKKLVKGPNYRRVNLKPYV